MSRFFYGDSDSDSASSDEEVLSDEEVEQSEEEDSSEEEVESSEEESSDDDDAGGAKRFIKNMSESEESEDEEVVKVVKSAKDKRLGELEGTIKLIENAQKINDWAVISTGVWELDLTDGLATFLELRVLERGVRD
jgi:translation initiation factor 3 subunit C